MCVRAATYEKMVKKNVSVKRERVENNTGYSENRINPSCFHTPCVKRQSFFSTN